MSALLLRSLPVLLAVCAACSAPRTVADAGTAGPEGPKRDSATAHAPAAAVAESAGGAISEEAFKRLHELKTEAAPVLRGKDLVSGAVRGYLALPDGARGPLPGVIVIHEWWGLNDNVKHWADRIAAEGYAALAIDLYDGVVAKTSDAAMSAMKTVDAGRALETLLLAERFLIDHPDVRATKTASIGWCFGGSKSLALGLASSDLDACVVYYGKPETDAAKLAGLKAPLLGIFGSRDASIPEARLTAFEEGLRSAGKTFRIERFDAEHAFANPSNPRYDEANAGRAWEIVRAFLAQHLGRQH